MIKTITKSVLFIFVLSLALAANQIVFAAAKCISNGVEVPCEELGNQIKSFMAWGIGIFIAIFILGTLGTIFWIMMIVHAVKYDIENKAMWLILMVFMGPIGALVYYFVVKRKFNKQFAPPTPTTMR
jgi:hypothetical protein